MRTGPVRSSNHGPKTVRTDLRTGSGPVFVRTDPSLVQAAKFIDTVKFSYVSYWTGASNKIKGSGIGILIASHLAKYVYKVNPTLVLHLKMGYIISDYYFVSR